MQSSRRNADRRLGTAKHAFWSLVPAPNFSMPHDDLLRMAQTVLAHPFHAGVARRGLAAGTRVRSLILARDAAVPSPSVQPERRTIRARQSLCH